MGSQLSRRIVDVSLGITVFLTVSGQWWFWLVLAMAAAVLITRHSAPQHSQTPEVHPDIAEALAATHGRPAASVMAMLSPEKARMVVELLGDPREGHLSLELLDGAASSRNTADVHDVIEILTTRHHRLMRYRAAMERLTL